MDIVFSRWARPLARNLRFENIQPSGSPRFPHVDKLGRSEFLLALMGEFAAAVWRGRRLPGRCMGRGLTAPFSDSITLHIEHNLIVFITFWRLIWISQPFTRLNWQFQAYIPKLTILVRPAVSSETSCKHWTLAWLAWGRASRTIYLYHQSWHDSWYFGISLLEKTDVWR